MVAAFKNRFVTWGAECSTPVVAAKSCSCECWMKLKNKSKYVFSHFLPFFILFHFSLCSCANSPLNLKGRYDYSKGWYHRVQKGDTLDTLSRKYNRSKALLARANGLDARKPLKPGVYVFIPPTNKPIAVSAPKPLNSSNTLKPAATNRSDKNDRAENDQKTRNSSQKSSSSPPPKTTSSQHRKVSATGFIWPLKGSITKRFSDSKSSPHKGIDIAAPSGALIVASKAGRVIYCDDEIPGYGKLVIIDHGKDISSVYAHNSKFLVRVGKFVNQGTPIALVGETGNATGPHLHFEIRKNAIPRDPLAYLP